MFKSAQPGQVVQKAEYEKRVRGLRLNLLNAQLELSEEKYPILIVIDGDDRLAREHLIKQMQEWMDGRYINTHVLSAPRPTDIGKPFLYRYWRSLPRRGSIGAFVHGWAQDTLEALFRGDLSQKEFERLLVYLRRFEDALVRDGTLLIKLWLHVPRKTLKKRIQGAKKRPKKHFKITKEDRTFHRDYEERISMAARVVERTTSTRAPWTIIESSDHRSCSLTAGETILAAFNERRIQTKQGEISSIAPPPREKPVLDTVDLTAALKREDYEKKLHRYQAKLFDLTEKARKAGISSMIVFQGWDAAGKGGAIRRLTAPIEGDLFNVIPIGAPTQEELAHHYLWRFWKQVPRPGHITIFDRSWYGRVLVERVEGFAPPSAWMRAFSEINDFEDQLVSSGIFIAKFWLHIDPEEQLRRFQERENTPYKKYKITEEDYRNRGKWQDYTRAVNDMVAKTSRRHAPWTLVSANDKRWARVQILKTVCAGLKKRLDSHRERRKGKKK